MQAINRYLSFNRVLKQTFGERVWRVPIDGGFTCPNIDGSKAAGGCVYCNNETLIQRNMVKTLPVGEQILRGMERIQKKRRVKKFIAYFQTFSSTYAPKEKLKALYQEALNVPGVAGLSVSTRPDCLPEDTIELLEEFHHKTYLWVEAGLESANNEVLSRMNRAHTVEDFTDACTRAKKRGLRICAHVILGLPGETRRDMMRIPQLLGDLQIDGIKIHNLFVPKKTVLEQMYHAGRVSLMDMEDYVELLIEFVERLPENMVIHRLMGEAPENLLVAPRWVLQKGRFLARLRQVMEEKNSFQGKCYNTRMSNVSKQ